MLCRTEVANTSKSTNSPHVLDDQILIAGNSKLPNATNPLPPIPNKGTRPRINTISKDPRKTSLEKSIDISSDHEEDFSQNLKVTRSNSQVNVYRESPWAHWYVQSLIAFHVFCIYVIYVFICYSSRKHLSLLLFLHPS